MVTLKTMGLFDGRFTRIFKNIFVAFSQKPLPEQIKSDQFLWKYIANMSEVFDTNIELIPDRRMEMTYITKTKDDPMENTVMVAFSGGKDSVAVVMKLREMGLEPCLFFVNGINRSYTSEIDYARHNAEKLGCKLYEYSLHIDGKSDYIENPTKNHLILALMVDKGLSLGIRNFSLGTVYTDGIDTTSKEYMLSDSIEPLRWLEEYYSQYVEDFKLHIVLKNETESYCIIARNDIDFLDTTFSCMTPARYKHNLVSHNTEKYEVNMLAGRCGSCYKCAQEAIVLNALGITSYNDRFINHCKNIISNMQDKFDATSLNPDDTPWLDEELIEEYRKG